MIDMKALEAGLPALTGYDFQTAEKKARMEGDNTPIISLSSIFQVELAAIAMGTTSVELKTLKIKDYNKIIQAVNAFLLIDSAETPVQSKKSGK